MKCYSASESKENHTIMWMNPEDTMLSERGQSQKYKHFMIPVI